MTVLGSDYIGRAIDEIQLNEADAPPLPRHLVTRDAELTALRDLLLDERRVLLNAANGLTGIGRTTLAAMLAREETIQQAFPDGVLWANLHGDQVSIRRAWVEKLGGGGHLHDLLADRRCLLILEDAQHADDLALLDVGGPGCATLITSRTPLGVPGATRTLGVMLPDQAVELIEKWAGDDDGPRQLLSDLAWRLGYLPLALKMVGAQARRRTWGRVQRDITRAHIDLAETGGPERTRDLRRIIHLTLDLLPDESVWAFERLGVFGAGATFTDEAAMTVCGMTHSLDPLIDAGLLDAWGDGRYTMHPVIAAYARDLLNADVRRRLEHDIASYYRERALDEQGEDVLNQIHAGWRQADDVESQYQWALAISVYLERRGRWRDMVDVLEQVAAAAESAGSPKRAGWAHYGMGYTYDPMGDRGKALVHLRRSLAYRREARDWHGEALTLRTLSRMQRPS